MKISFDYDETITTARGMELAQKLIDEGNTLYIISARQDKAPMLNRADKLGIPHSRVYATGSNKNKIEKIIELEIERHYDNNSDVIKELGSKGYQFFTDEEVFEEIKELLDHPKLSDDYKFNKIQEYIEQFKIVYGNTRTRNNTIKSANVHKFKYNTETGELVVKFQDGSVYTYFKVSQSDFDKFASGSGGVCKTSGENKWGKWEVGKSPSVGANVWQILMNYSYKKGGFID